MAFSFSNCLIPQGSGVNQMYGDCCCEFNCNVTTNEAIILDSLTGGFVNELFFLSSPPKIYIAGVLQTFPLVLNANDTFEIQMEICASGAENDDTLKLTFVDEFVNQIDFNFDLLAIDLSTSVSPTSFAFGNTVVGSTKTLGFQIQNPTTGCCYGYTITTSCPDLVVTPDVSNTLCPGDKQSDFKLDWTPPAVGSLDCVITVTTDCQTYDFPVTGNAINPPSGGGERVEQKNKVDQTTRVEACSPRTANNRCQTAQTLKSAIKTNARRFGKR